MHDVTIISRNDKLTRYYTGIPTYNCLVALVDYLDPKVRAMRAWKGSNSEKQYASVANQLFSVLIRLQLALLPLMSVEDSKFLKQPTIAYSLHALLWLLSKELDVSISIM